MMKWQISDLFGMSVYSDKAVFLGKVEDVVLDVTNKKISGLALTSVNQNVLDYARSLNIPVLEYASGDAYADACDAFYDKVFVSE